MWFHHYHYLHNHDLLVTACWWQLLLIILVHIGFSGIRETIPGKDKRPASDSADQPHKQLRKEFPIHDCEGKSRGHEVNNPIQIPSLISSS